MKRRWIAVAGLGTALAGGTWWWQQRDVPTPQLKPGAMQRIEPEAATSRPVHTAFVARKTVSAERCTPPPGSPSPEQPLQTPVPADMPATRFANAKLLPLAGFSIDARVLSARHYDEDREAEYAPVDLALGWARMRNDDVLSKLEVNQQHRWYFYRWRDQPPLPAREIRTSSANMHMIPGDHRVEAALRGIKPGQRVRIDGWLVEVQARDGWKWRSSTTRDDGGQGGCEVIRVCRVSVE